MIMSILYLVHLAVWYLSSNSYNKALGCRHSHPRLIARNAPSSRRHDPQYVRMSFWSITTIATHSFSLYNFAMETDGFSDGHTEFKTSLRKGIEKRNKTILRQWAGIMRLRSTQLQPALPYKPPCGRSNASFGKRHHNI